MHDIVARLKAENGWRVVCRDSAKETSLVFHEVAGWALVGFLDPTCQHVSVRALPTSLSGEILSDRVNYVGMIGPNEDARAWLKKFETENDE